MFLQWSFHIRDIGVDGLETLTYSEAQLQDQIYSLKQRYQANEVFYLATCNRVEFLLYSQKSFTSTLPDFTQLKPQVKTNLKDITNYWLSVCCSLDSIVFGENQIIGQVKKAFSNLQKKQLLGAEISKFMHLIFRESKWIRNNSSLARIQTSVSAVVAKRIQSLFKNEGSVLLVGFGETNQLLYKYLKKKQKYKILITNRTLSKVEAAASAETQIIPWDHFSKNDLPRVDVVCLAVSNKKNILDLAKLSSLQPQYVFDLSVPANAEADLVNKTSQYIGIDEIKAAVEKNKQESVALIQEVGVLVQSSCQKILSDLSKKSLDDIITINIQKSIEIHQKTLENELFKTLNSDQLEVVKLWSEKLVKKINHIHLSSIKEVYSELTNPTDPVL